MSNHQTHGAASAWGVLCLTCLLLCAAVAPLCGADTVATNSATNRAVTSLLNSNTLSTNLTNLAGMAGGTNAPAHRSVSGWGKKLKEGGNTALVQILLSVFGAGFIFERLAHCRRKHFVPEGLSERARQLWKTGKFAELESLVQQEPSTLARAISFVVKHRHNTAADVSALTGEVVSRELSSHFQRAYPLGVVATLEPLLGLLGMILGMIETFETVALAGALGDPTQLATGISEALVTTGLGLATAIPFLALYHFFKHKTNTFGTMLEEEMTDLLAEWLLTTEKPKSGGR